MLDNNDINFNELKAGQTREKLEQIHGKPQKNNDKKAGAGGFGHYNLSPEIVKAIRAKGYNMPTPI
jgi:superfamily II DNA/RNA helicase